ncbi:IclR family transcriptional regulator [Chitinasiproducens palmae]|nr:IclR family transcriptional regulator [Chitinasiproducens palmae]
MSSAQQPDDDADVPKQSGIQSVELGFRLITELMGAREALSLTELARRIGMSPSKARGYLISFVRLGIAQQQQGGGLYDLGPTAIRLGLAAMNRIDALACARAQLPALRAALRETVCLCVWGDHGPVVIDKLEGAGHAPFELRLGTSVPLLSTATGRTFLAWLPEERYAPLLRLTSEASLRQATPEHVALERMIETVRRDGCAVVGDVELPGFASVAVPLLDHRGALIATVNAIGPSNAFDVSVDGSPARALRAFARDVAERAGAPLHRSDTSRPGR